jgi:hypothetical protein
MATVTPPRPITVQSSEARRKLAASKAKTDYHDAPLFPPVFAAFSEAADVDFALTEGLSKAEPIVFDLRVRTPTSVLKCLDLLADATHTKWEIRNETVVFRKSTETVDERTVLVPIPRTAR